MAPPTTDWNMITVTGRITGIDGAPQTGSVTFQFSQRTIDYMSNTIIIPRPKTATLATDGTFTIDIPATDDPDIYPATGLYYTYTENLDQGGGGTYQIEVPVDAVDGAVQISQLIGSGGITPAPPVVTYVTVQGVQALIATALVGIEGSGTGYIDEQIYEKSAGLRIGVHYPGTELSTGQGATISDITSLESNLGQKVDVVRIFPQFNPNATYSLNAFNTDCEDYLDAGKQMFLNVEANGTLQQHIDGVFNNLYTSVGTRVAEYMAANPNAKPFIITTLHEMNLSDNYLWNPFTATNLAYASGNEVTSINNFKQAFINASNRIRAAAGAENVKIVLEFGPNNFSSKPYQFKDFNPGNQYYDMAGVNPYNRYLISSGSAAWRHLETILKRVTSQFMEMCPEKDWIIGECSTTPDGQVNKVNVTGGGTGYLNGGSGIINGIITSALGQDATCKFTVTNGVISNSTDGATLSPKNTGSATNMVNRGQGYRTSGNPTVVLESGTNGTPATFSIEISGEKYSKSDWFYKALRYLISVPNYKVVCFFLENKQTTGDNLDTRLFSLNTTDDYKGFKKGLAVARRRPSSYDPQVLVSGSPIINRDVHANDVSKWFVKGINSGGTNTTTGAWARTVGEINLPGDADPRVVSLANTVGKLTTGAMRLVHNAVQAAAVGTNYGYQKIPYKTEAPNQHVSGIALIRGKRTAAGGVMIASPLLSTSETTPNFQGSGPGFELQDNWQFVTFTIAHGNFFNTQTAWNEPFYHIGFDIGQSSAAFELQVAMLAIYYGQDIQAIPSSRTQVNQVCYLADANYSMVTGVSSAGGSTAEFNVFGPSTTLSAPRTITLEAGDKTIVNTAQWFGDFSGTCNSTNTITINVTGGGTIRIPGNATPQTSIVLNSPHSIVRILWDGETYVQIGKNF